MKSDSHSRLFAFLLIGILSFHVFSNRVWNNRNIIEGDTFSYYAYLPAFFIKHDVSLKFLDSDRQSSFNNLWFSISEKGTRFTKMPVGWALMNAPFFLAAHAIAKMGGWPADGFSLPYCTAICLAAWFYVCIAILLMQKFLSKYFSSLVVSITLALIVFGTNLYYYTVFDAGMTHGISFFLFTCLLMVTRKWHEKPTIFNSALTGLILALIVLTRASNAIVVFIFILYRVFDWHSFKEKLDFLLMNWRFIATIAIASFIVLIPQFAYWHLISGQFIYYSYTDEHFFFNNPHLFEGLFGFRKGWLIYTPVMALPVLSLFSFRGVKEWRLGLLIFLFLNVYIILSWWCWWYGGSFGGRSFIESYAFLTLPLALLVQLTTSKKRLLIPTLVLVAFLVFVNVFQTVQYMHAVIHYDSMTADSYKAIFLKNKIPDGYFSLICHPDYYNAKLGLPERGDCNPHDHNNP